MTVSNESVETAARTAAAPLIAAQALEGLTRSSPRLPAELRSHVFEIVFEVVDKFNFPAQNCGNLPGVVEIGDVCGEVEKRTVALLRAAALRGQG